MAHHYYCPSQNIAPDGRTLTLTGDEAAHLSRVMRIRPGQPLTCFDGCGMHYDCTVTAVGDAAVSCDILAAAPGAAEPSVQVTLYAGYPKGDKLEHIIQKATELGAVRIVPFFSRYCVVTPKKEEQKNARYARIAFEAVKQSARDRIPEVALPLPFAAMLKELPEYDAALFCYEAQTGGPSLRQCVQAAQEKAAAEGRAPRIAVITGSEGGFSEQEAEAAAVVSTLIGLGPRILRCETAPLAALTAILAFAGDLE